MYRTIKRLLASALAVAALGTQMVSASIAAPILTVRAASKAIETMGGDPISNAQISTDSAKDTRFHNPLLPDHFCADPTAVTYQDRLYVFGTNDHQQYEAKGADVDNTYEQIRSLVVLSTDDMVNWTYHGIIDVGAVAPWIMNAWAPSVVSRVEADGLTHFYLYFSNNGTGVGVITATNPLGPWSDPLGKPLITASAQGLHDCPNPFDPGVVIDDDGVGWLSFGGGKAATGTTYMPGSSRIVQLGENMLSFASAFAEIPAPYFFEASELNYINGTYVYTYNSDWSDHSEQWEYDCPVPSGCSMVYMTTKTPLDATSWTMKGEYFQNPGMSGFDYSNNHTHLHKFRGEYYLFYHTLMLKAAMGIKGGYRSLCVDRIAVQEDSVTIEKIGGTKKGTSAIQPVQPFTAQNAASSQNWSAMTIDGSDAKAPVVKSMKPGAWVCAGSVAFTESEDEIEQPPVKLEQTSVSRISYELTVTAVDKPTTVSMHPSTKAGDCTGSVAVTGKGTYTISCALGDAELLQNLGYFTVDNDASISFVVERMTLNDAYSFDLAVELTNTREWADGLKNIWNGFADGDAVYTTDRAVLRYQASTDAIIFLADPSSATGGTGSAPLLGTPVTFLAKVQGTGRVEVRLDAPTGLLLTSVAFETPNAVQEIMNLDVAAIGGTHDLYFVCSAADISLYTWQFVLRSDDQVPFDVNADGVFSKEDVTMMQEFLLGAGTLTNWRAGEANGDGVLDVRDLTAMKRAFLGND